MLRSILVLTLLCTALAGCDRGQPAAPAAPPIDAPAPDRKQRFAWDEGAQAFTFMGQPLAAAKTWTFQDSTDGFVVDGGTAALVEPAGLRVATSGAHLVVRSPADLHLDGSRHSLVLIRLTRIRQAGRWDGALVWRTADHGESVAFHTKPLRDARPQLGETMILAYDMARPKQGGEDWTTSYVEQIRLDLDANPGGEFVIRQMAVVTNPGAEALGPAPLAKAPIAASPSK